MFLKGYIEKAGTGTEDIISKCVNYGLGKPEFHQDSDFKVIIWRKQVDQKTEEVTQKMQQLSQKMPQVGQKREEVSQKIEQLSQKAQQLSQKMSYKTIEGILFAINNDAYISIKSLSSLCECTDKTIKRYLSFLTEHGFISHVGPDKGGYRVINLEKLKV